MFPGKTGRYVVAAFVKCFKSNTGFGTLKGKAMLWSRILFKEYVSPLLRFPLHPPGSAGATKWIRHIRRGLPSALESPGKEIRGLPSTGKRIVISLAR